MISSNYSSPEKIDKLSTEDLLNTLRVVNAFREHMTYKSKELTMDAFVKMNGLENIRNTIKYLLFGQDGYLERIINSIFSPEYHLDHFSESCIEELYGWVNKEDIPIGNQKIFKSMQWLGFGKVV